MKVIVPILSVILNLNPILTPTKASLETALARHEAIWILAPLADSIENQILAEMAEESLWKEKLRHWESMSHEDYLNLILSHNRTVTHSEVHREIVVEPNPEWLAPFDAEVAEEFFYRFSQLKGGIHKQLLFRVEPH